MQFKNVQQIDAEDELTASKAKDEHEKQGKKAIAILKKVLGERVKDVRLSKGSTKALHA